MAERIDRKAILYVRKAVTHLQGVTIIASLKGRGESVTEGGNQRGEISVKPGAMVMPPRTSSTFK